MSESNSLQQEIQALAKSDFFKGVPLPALERLFAWSRIVTMKVGDFVIHEGEYESICFITLSGKYKVSVLDSSSGKHRQIDQVSGGAMIGEMSALSGRSRTADVECLKKGEVLKVSVEEFARFLDNAPAFKERMDEEYRTRALYTTLRKIDIFSPIADETINLLAKNVELVTYQKGERIFKAGEEADCIYLVRDGFMKMARNMNETEGVFFDSRFDKAQVAAQRREKEKWYTIAYLGRDSYFGERALFFHRNRVMNATAVTRVELVRIGFADFGEMMRRHPDVEETMKEIAKTRYSNEILGGGQERQEALSWMESQDLLVGEKILVMNLDLCVRCLNCLDACAGLHQGISRITHNGIRFRNILIPTSCRHCREPSCMIGCPTGAIQRDKNGEVFHEESCIGCGNCARRCPFSNISIVDLKKQGKRRTFSLAWFGQGTNKEDESGSEKISPRKRLKKAVKCDMCKGYKNLGCLHNCPTGAILSVVPSQFFSGEMK